MGLDLDDVAVVFAWLAELVCKNGNGKMGRGRRAKRDRQVAIYLADSRTLIISADTQS